MADIVEVVRCRDCHFFIKKTATGGDVIGQCDLHGKMYMFGEDYCSYGSKDKEKTDEQTRKNL